MTEINSNPFSRPAVQVYTTTHCRVYGEESDQLLLRTTVFILSLYWINEMDSVCNQSHIGRCVCITDIMNMLPPKILL